VADRLRTKDRRVGSVLQKYQDGSVNRCEWNSFLHGEFSKRKREKVSRERIGHRRKVNVKSEARGARFSVFSFQFSVFSFQFSVFSFQFSVFSFQFSVFSFQFSGAAERVLGSWLKTKHQEIETTGHLPQSRARWMGTDFVPLGDKT
jgi:hypothetical protein